MKFQKGILSEEEARAAGVKIDAGTELKPVTQAQPKPAARPVPVYVEKDRLFETTEKVSSSSRHYLVLLGIVAVIVIVGGAIVFYYVQPGVGDVVRAPRGGEDAVREYFLGTVKRTATDVTFYKCDGFYWARVGVETRTDLPNPLMKVGTFKAKLTGQEGAWQVSDATAVQSQDQDVPCK